MPPSKTDLISTSAWSATVNLFLTTGFPFTHAKGAPEAVGSGQHALAVDQRQPVEASIFIEARDIERAVIQQVHIGGPILGVIAPGADEFVEIREAGVVASIGGHPAIGVYDGIGTLMGEVALGGAFDWHRVAIAPEITAYVFLACENRSLGRGAAGTIIQRAGHVFAGWIGQGLFITLN